MGTSTSSISSPSVNETASTQKINPTNDYTPADHLLISEILYNPIGIEPDGEWIEIYNPTSIPINLSGYKIGDEETEGGSEGMFQFPEKTVILATGKVTIANKALAFFSRWDKNPDFELVETDPNVPNLTKYTSWANGSVSLSNTGDEVLLLDKDNLFVDIANWGSSVFQPNPHPGVPEGHSLERYPADKDTDDCSQDFIEQNNPNPETGGAIVDTTPPTGAIVITNSTDPAGTDSTYTNSTSVTLTLSASDGAGLGVAEMQISNDGIFDTEPWETYATSKAWILTSDDGQKTVYVLYKDNAGNISDADPTTPENQPYSDTIILDATPPLSPNNNIITPPGPTKNNKPIIQGEVDSETFEVWVWFVEEGGGGYLVLGTISPADLTYSTSENLFYDGQNFIEELPDGSYTVFVYANDQVGNSSEDVVVASNYIIDTTPPSAPSDLKIINRNTNSLTFSWQESTDNLSGVAGYIVLWGLSWGNHPVLMDVGTATSATLAGLSPGKTYYFMVACYDQAGNESFSEEISATTLKPSPILIQKAEAVSPPSLSITPEKEKVVKEEPKEGEIKGAEETPQPPAEAKKLSRLLTWLIVIGILLILGFGWWYFIIREKQFKLPLRRW